MAIIIVGAPLSAIRGTIGGITYSANGSGPFAKAWARGPNPRTVPQNTQRNILSGFASAWRSLSPANKATWVAYAALPAQDLINSLGVTYSLSGFNWFIRINTHLTAAGAAQRDAAPTLTRPVAPIIQLLVVTITGSPTASRIQYTVASPGLPEFHTVYIRLFNSIGRLQAAHNFSLLRVAIPNPSRNIGITSELLSTFGTIALGQKAFAETNVQDAHGQRGPVAVANIDVTAP